MKLIYIKSIEVNPKFNGVYNHLGFYYRQKKAFDKSIETYLKTIENDSTNQEANSNLAQLYMMKPDKSELSLKANNRILVSDPLNIDALLRVAEINKRIKFYDASIEVCRKIINIDPKLTDKYLYGNEAERQKLKEQVEKIGEAYSIMGAAYRYKGDYKKRIDSYIIAAKLGNNASQDLLKNEKIKWE